MSNVLKTYGLSILLVVLWVSLVNPVFGHHETAKAKEGKIEPQGKSEDTFIENMSSVESVPITPISTDLSMRKIMEDGIVGTLETIWICDQMDSFWLDYQRYEFARKTLYVRNIMVDDVIAILKKLRFEELRLEMAKYAYHRILNKGDYASIFEMFEFNSSKKELYQYIKDH